MRVFLLVLAALPVTAQPRIDNVLLKMVPPGSTSLVGARMDRIETTEFYRKLLDERKMPQVERFAAETGFDPRHDVREMLLAGTASGSVLLVRGRFSLKQEPLRQTNTKMIRHGNYSIRTAGEAGFCILDGSLAAAGDLPSLEAALDEWTAGKHSAAAPLLARIKEISPDAQFWGVSTGVTSFLTDNMPRAGGRGGGIDFSKIFRGLENTWFQADFRTGFRGQLHGETATEQDAMNLRDTAKGLIGFGRLSVPEKQPELLKLWDGIAVEQQGKSVRIRAEIPQDQVDQLVRLLSPPAGARARDGQGSPGPRQDSPPAAAKP